MKVGTTIAVAGAVIGVVLGALFSQIYPTVPITAALAALFGLIGIAVALGVAGAWRWWRRGKDGAGREPGASPADRSGGAMNLVMVLIAALLAVIAWLGSIFMGEEMAPYQEPTKTVGERGKQKMPETAPPERLPPAAKNGGPPPAAENGGPAAADNGGSPSGGGAGRAPASAPSILSSVFDFLETVGAEKDGYGLYSYALLPAPSARAEAFLGRVFATTGAAAISLIAPKNLNLIYLPAKGSTVESLVAGLLSGRNPPADVFARDAYNYPLAVRLLATICATPHESMKALCETDLSRGPYLFTYAKPASDLATVPPPFLMVDLSDVHPDAFGEFVAAYKAQVKRADYPDRERIDTFRLGLLKISLTAADWVSPVTKAIKDIVHGGEG